MAIDNNAFKFLLTPTDAFESSLEEPFEWPSAPGAETPLPYHDGESALAWLKKKMDRNWTDQLDGMQDHLVDEILDDRQ